MGVLAVVGGVHPALRHGAAQAVVRRSHLPHQGLQVVRLHAVVLLNNDYIQQMFIKTTCPISHHCPPPKPPKYAATGSCGVHCNTLTHTLLQTSHHSDDVTKKKLPHVNLDKPTTECT